MKNIIVLFLFALLAVSCSKGTVEVKGKVEGGSPLERIEIIEGSGVATLPLINMGVNEKGEFTGSFEAPESGMYAITYGGPMGMIYLKKGEPLEISWNAADFPKSIVVKGANKANNDFLKETQKFFEDYASKVNVQQIITKEEAPFLVDFNKVKTDLLKNVEDTGKKLNADKEVIEWKKNETNAKLLGLLGAYEQNHGSIVNKPDFKVSAKFNEVAKSLVSDQDKMVKEVPVYREYLLNKMSKDFSEFAAKQKMAPDKLMGETFSEFLATKKDLSQTTKDYLYAYVIAQSDITPMNAVKYDKIAELTNKNVKDSKVKEGLLNIQKVIMGLKVGSDAPNGKLSTEDGKSVSISDFKGKPTVVMFYASWNPAIADRVLPTLKEYSDFYKGKVDFAFVDLDDTEAQFKKTSAALLKGVSGKNYYAANGLNSDMAKEFGVYGFKLPSFVIIGADNKIASRSFYNLSDPDFVTALQKLTGLKPPAKAPSVQQMPAQPEPVAEPEAAKKQAAPEAATK